jgi:NhaA family Na+:H+ antiporter
MKRISDLQFQLTNAFKNFFSSQKISGILLLLATLLSLILANSSFSENYIHFWEVNRTITSSVHFSLLHIINDGLMTIFFFLVGLEIKRELLSGELKGFDKASLPVAAALGGMLVPALIYSYFNSGFQTISGWGIPMATDIAFAIGIISILGNRISNAAKVFITALAVVDDLGAVLVIALFYSSGLHYLYLAFAALIVIGLLLLNRFKVTHGAFYLFGGVILWYCIFSSGIHSTLAGVILAATIPFSGNEKSLLERFEHSLHQPVNLLIMPIFAMANTAIIISGTLTDHLSSHEGLGIVFGLVFGKPLGIALFVGLTLIFLKKKLPQGITLQSLIGLGFLGGIGFTMSIFISMLAFNDGNLIVTSKIAIMIGSLVSALLGFIILYFQKETNE